MLPLVTKRICTLGFSGICDKVGTQGRDCSRWFIGNALFIGNAPIIPFIGNALGVVFRLAGRRSGSSRILRCCCRTPVIWVPAGSDKRRCRHKPEGSFSSRRRRIRHSFVIATRVQERSGSNVVIAAAMCAVSGPRSFWYTSPSGPTMNVMMPDDSNTAGQATSAKPPVM
jgi:hypothetical protein